MDDKILVQNFLRNRTRQHFLALFNLYSGSLMRVAIYLSRNNRDLAEDLVQETWISAIENLGHFAWKSWLTAILLNKYRDNLRKKQDFEPLDGVESVSNQSKGDLPLDIRKAILQLSDGYRQILILHDLEGFKHVEIGELLGISAGTSKSQLFHARRAMRHLLNEYKV